MHRLTSPCEEQLGLGLLLQYHCGCASAWLMLLTNMHLHQRCQPATVGPAARIPHHGFPALQQSTDACCDCGGSLRFHQQRWPITRLSRPWQAVREAESPATRRVGRLVGPQRQQPPAQPGCQPTGAQHASLHSHPRGATAHLIFQPLRHDVTSDLSVSLSCPQ